jgi:sugar/nucleoside kinase (ribokinase family)
MSEAPYIVVLGGPALDLLARVPYFPSVDGNVVATETQRQPGGVGANIAAGLAHLGNRVILLGATGDDDIGRFLRAKLESVGVETRYMVERADTVTQSCFIAVTPHGDRVIYGLPGATALERPEEINHEVIRRACGLHIAPAYKKVALAAIATAREHDLFVSYTPADVWWPHGPQAVREIARQVDLLIVNRVEAAALTGLDAPETALHRLLEWGYGPAILTQGEEGVLLGDHGQVITLPAYPVEDVRDTTGAGDSFTAGTITGVTINLPLSRAARLGTAVAALKLRRIGAQAGLPTLEEAMNLALQQAEHLQQDQQPTSHKERGR